MNSIVVNGVLEIETETGTLLGLLTGIKPRRFVHADSVSIRKSEGIVVDLDGTRHSWNINNFIEYEGQITALGPFLPKTQPFQSRSPDIQVLRAVLLVARKLSEDGFPLAGLDEEILRWTSNGGLFVYPPKLVEFVYGLNPLFDRYETRTRWIHPDLDGESAWCFSLGMLAWFILTGLDAFAEEKDEERRERIRAGVLPSIEEILSDLDSDAVELITKSLNPSLGKATSLDEWEKQIFHWLENGLPVLNPETIAKAHDSQFFLQERKLRTQRWVRQKGWKLFVSVGIFVCVLLLGKEPIRKALEPPSTAGFLPLQVAQSYYEAIADLDSELMEDCLGRGVGKSDRHLVDSFYVISRVRRAYENGEKYEDAEKWLNDGQKELPKGIQVWGVTDLVLSPLSQETIKSSYRIWIPGGEYGKNGSPTYQSREDVLFFEKKRGEWVISRIDRQIKPQG